MNKFFLLFFIPLITFSAKAQTIADPGRSVQPYGKVSVEDLELKTCDFEKDANAMVLFNKADIYYDFDFRLTAEYHKRIKIFNDKGKDVANIRIEFYGGYGAETLYSVDAQTINLVNGKAEITKLDRSQFYLKHIDKSRFAWVFTMPNIKPGSVIEYQYKWSTPIRYNFPNWFFQDRIPTRYSEIKTEIPQMFVFRTQLRTSGFFAKHTSTSEMRYIGGGSSGRPYNTDIEVIAMTNIRSLPDEPYMSSFIDNLQGIFFEYVSNTPLGGAQSDYSGTWPNVGGLLADDDNFGGQLKKSLKNEDVIINKAKTFKTDDEKIAYLFNEVKNEMKWNGINRWYTSDGTATAWENKTGNCTEINLVLYHLLKKSGVNAFPMVVSTREHGKVNSNNPVIYQFNRAVVYIPVDSTKKYVLDAADKYNIYNETPDYILNSPGLFINKETKTFELLNIKKKEPVKEIISVVADIKPDGKIAGTLQRYSYSYNRINDVKRYKTDGEEKYINYLKNGDNSLKLTALKFENMEVDTLPLVQNMNFDLDATGTDGSYIYFKPNMMPPAYSTAFLEETRTTNIDFAYPNIYSMSGNYKIPAGYKIEALPADIALAMPDKTIIFKRVVARQEDNIIVRYVLNIKNPIYYSGRYPEFFNFLKKMNELMNEQIVLKKI